MKRMAGWYEPRLKMGETVFEGDFAKKCQEWRDKRRKLQNAKDKAVHKGENAVMEFIALCNCKLHYILDIRKQQIEELVFKQFSWS
jgi:hypothetical protein